MAINENHYMEVAKDLHIFKYCSYILRSAVGCSFATLWVAHMLLIVTIMNWNTTRCMCVHNVYVPC